MKRKWEQLLTRREYRKARNFARDRRADTLPDDDQGILLKGEMPDVKWEDRTEDMTRNPAGTGFGRRDTDINASNLVTKKLVFIAVVLVEVICLTGDTLFLRGDCF